jgi:hypothetical protein
MLGLLESLFLAVINLTLVGLDVIAFFLVIRLLTLRWPKAMFLAFNRVGAPLVDPMIATLARAMPGIGNRQAVRARKIEATTLLAGVVAFRLAVAGIVFFLVRKGAGEVVTVWHV